MTIYNRGGAISEGAKYEQCFPLISQNFLVPADYFKAGAYIPSNHRNERLGGYIDLLQGSYNRLISRTDYPVAFSYYNWFGYSTRLIRDFLMSELPEVGGAPIEDDRTLLGSAITHYLACGVAVFARTENDGDGVMYLIPPHLFYPLEDGQTVHVVPQGPERVMLRMDAEVQLWTFQGVGIEDWQVPRGSLGEQLVQERSAPVRTIWTVRAEPADCLFFWNKCLSGDGGTSRRLHVDLQSFLESALNWVHDSNSQTCDGRITPCFTSFGGA